MISKRKLAALAAQHLGTEAKRLPIFRKNPEQPPGPSSFERSKEKLKRCSRCPATLPRSSMAKVLNPTPHRGARWVCPSCLARTGSPV